MTTDFKFDFLYCRFYDSHSEFGDMYREFTCFLLGNCHFVAKDYELEMFWSPFWLGKGKTYDSAEVVQSDWPGYVSRESSCESVDRGHCRHGKTVGSRHEIASGVGV